MGSLAGGVAAVARCAAGLGGAGGGPLPLFPSVWWVETRSSCTAGGRRRRLLLPREPLLANVILDAESGRFGVSLLRPTSSGCSRWGRSSDPRGQPRLAPDDLIESGVVELVCARARAAPALRCAARLPRDRGGREHGARADRRKRLRARRQAALVIFDPSRPALRIRVGVAYEGRAERAAPGAGQLAAACARRRSRSRAPRLRPRAPPCRGAARVHRPAHPERGAGRDAHPRLVRLELCDELAARPHRTARSAAAAPGTRDRCR